MTIYEADWICPVSSPPIRNGCIAVENGRIVPLPLGEREARARQGEALKNGAPAPGEGFDRLSFPGCAIIPGFVNAHAHLELTILRGFLDDLPFSEWIPRLTRAKYQQLTRDEMLASARLGCMEMLRAGVTSVGEVMDLGTAWQAMREFGLQGIAYQEVFGPSESQVEQAVTDLIKKVDAYRDDETETLRVGVSPHAPYTVSAKLYEAVNWYAEQDRVPLATHIAESEDEGMFVRWGAGVFAERWAERGIPVTPPGCTPVAYLDGLGLLRPETLLVHVIDLEDADFDILREKGPAVVHCPKSNAKLGHGIARLAEIRAAGVAIGLGTDSVASNNVVDMFEEMRTAIFQQRGKGIDAQTAFRMATLGGAECLGLSDHLGSLDVGKRADFVVIDLNDLAVQPVYDPINTMVYSASRSNVRATFIGGREIKVDPKDLVRECAAIAERLI
jgi:cytosine/adenosine deaminase-related metal-dependent hydrolase